MEDALAVMAHLEAKSATRVKAPGATEEHSTALDARVDKLVSSIGELIARIPPSALSN